MTSFNSSTIFTDVWGIVTNSDYFLYIFIGGRGIGKTYSTLKGSLLDEVKILYVRRTATEVDSTCNKEFNPYKAINLDLERNVEIEKLGKDRFLINEHLDDENVANFKNYGYGGALSTFGNLRGADFSDVEYIVFDEFIDSTGINRLKNSAFLLFNLIETVNRNRELLGRNAVKVILLSNSNTINDDILRTLKLGQVIYEMKLHNETIYTDIDRGIYLSLLDNKKVSDLKKETALYKLTKGTRFYDMAIKNEFTLDYFGDIAKIRYNELVPVVAYENIYFYKHKTREFILASYRKANCKRYTKEQLKAFKRDYGFMFMKYVEQAKIMFINYDLKLEFENIW